MKLHITYVPKIEFPEGAIVHFSKNGFGLALCGNGWIDSSNDPGNITCIDCIERLSEESLALMNCDSGRPFWFWERPGYLAGPAEEARYG